MSQTKFTELRKLVRDQIKAHLLPSDTKPKQVTASPLIHATRCSLCKDLIPLGDSMYTIAFDGVSAGLQQAQVHFECHAAWQAEVGHIDTDAYPFTTDTLLRFHKAIRDALKADDDTPPDTPKPHGVRATSDWGKDRDDVERQLRARGISFTPIVW
jgi:hypothetical protein